MATFDQRNQKVKHQSNIAGDVNVVISENHAQFAQEIQKLQREVKLAVDMGQLNSAAAIEVEAKLQQVISQINSQKPDKKNLLERLQEAKELISGVASAAGLIKMLMEAAELARRLF